VKDNFGGPDKTFTSTALTPEQAAKLGYDLPGIIKAINTGLMTENATLREHNAELENMLGALNNATDQTSPGWFSRVFSMFRS
jgi:hypothetical protein